MAEFNTLAEWNAELDRLRKAEGIARWVWINSPYQRSTSQPDNCAMNYFMAVEERSAVEVALARWLSDQCLTQSQASGTLKT